jgi:hypothetical protein
MVDYGCRTGDQALRHALRDSRWAYYEFLNFVTNKSEPLTVHATAFRQDTVWSPVCARMITKRENPYIELQNVWRTQRILKQYHSANCIDTHRHTTPENSPTRIHDQFPCITYQDRKYVLAFYAAWNRREAEITHRGVKLKSRVGSKNLTARMKHCKYR